MEVGEVGPYPRYDLQHVGPPSQRPTNAEYDRYLWLVSLIMRAGCDEATIYEAHPFLVKDVLTSAILVAANEALLEIGELVEAEEEDRALMAERMARGRRGLERWWDSELGLCLDYDLRRDRTLRVRTIAGFAPLIAGGQIGSAVARYIPQRTMMVDTAIRSILVTSLMPVEVSLNVRRSEPL